MANFVLVLPFDTNGKLFVPYVYTDFAIYQLVQFQK